MLQHGACQQKLDRSLARPSASLRDNILPEIPWSTGAAVTVPSDCVPCDIDSSQTCFAAAKPTVLFAQRMNGDNLALLLISSRFRAVHSYSMSYLCLRPGHEAKPTSKSPHDPEHLYGTSFTTAVRTPPPPPEHPRCTPRPPRGGACWGRPTSVPCPRRAASSVGRCNLVASRGHRSRCLPALQGLKLWSGSRVAQPGTDCNGPITPRIDVHCRMQAIAI